MVHGSENPILARNQAPRWLLSCIYALAASPRRLLGNDPCAACKKAAPCFSLACMDGKMNTEGPFAKCADAKGSCGTCFPGSACGILPLGSTRSPTATPTPPVGKSLVPSWGERKRLFSYLLALPLELTCGPLQQRVQTRVTQWSLKWQRPGVAMTTIHVELQRLTGFAAMLWLRSCALEHARSAVPPFFTATRLAEFSVLQLNLLLGLGAQRVQTKPSAWPQHNNATAPLTVAT